MAKNFSDTVVQTVANDVDDYWKGDHSQVKQVIKGYGPCWESHKALPIDKWEVYGGNCSKPLIQDADVYVGLDHSMKLTKRQLPWNKGHELEYLIPDMGVPSNPDEFRKLIGWLAERVRDGDKVHVGCIGGHGRTGLVLAALVSVMMDDEDAITYVRTNYCDHAVESASQVDFLVEHFGVKGVKGYKQSKQYSSTGSVESGIIFIKAIQAQFSLWGK